MYFFYQIVTDRIDLYKQTDQMLLIACAKHDEKPNTIKSDIKNFSGIFEDFWNNMHSRYVYWDVDTTNWDNIYNNYAPVFSKLDLQNPTDVIRSVSYFRNMTAGLLDGHYSIRFHHPLLKDSVIYPAQARQLISSDFHYPYNYQVIDTTYLDDGYLVGFDSSQPSQEPLVAIAGTINHKVLYFHCNRFSLYNSYQAKVQNGIRNTLDCFFQALSSGSYNGVIIDVRGNPGATLQI